MKKSKIAIIALVAVVAIIGVTAGGFFGLKVIGEKNYWKASVIENIENVCGYTEKDALEMINEYDAGEKEIIDFLVNGQEDIAEKHNKKIEELNGIITNFFKDKYQLDVSEKLKKLDVKAAEFEQFGIDGYYNNYDGYDIVYVNKELFEYDDYDGFEHTYIHETMHYLGTAEKGSGNLGYIYEGITQCLTIEIYEYAGLSDGNYCIAEDYYVQCVDAVNEIIEQSPEIIKEVIAGEGNYNLEEKLNSPFKGQNFADNLNFALQEMLSGSNDTEYEVRLLVSEYVKATGGNDVDIDFAKNFGLQWFLN